MRDPKSADILFIMPPVLRFCKQNSYSYPLGLGYMVSYLQPHGINALIYNADIYEGGTADLNVEKAELWDDFLKACSDSEHPVWKEIENVLMDIQPKAVGISSKAVDIPSTIRLAEICKRVSPDTVVMLGGTSSTISWEYLINKTTSFDFYVLGEGEETVLELMQWILGSREASDLKKINGIVYKDSSDKLVVNPGRGLVMDLDQFPFPNREVMFRVNNDQDYEFILETGDILASRGCPFPCQFCSASASWGTKKSRLRSIDNIISEIVMLKEKYNQKFFIFWDDLFTVNRKRVKEFCRRLIDMKLDIEWLCLIRINDVDTELLQLMKDAGCREIQIGIESGSDRVLDLIKKGTTLEKIYEKFPIIKSLGIRWSIFLVLGFPGEKKHEMISSMKLINTLLPNRVEIRLFSPYPGTPFFHQLKAQGKIGDDFFKYDVFNPQNNFTGTMSNDEFKELAMKALYCSDSYNANPGKKVDLSYLEPVEDPVVSVVLGTYNRIEFLKFAIDTIRNELEGIRSEIIIVDGGSTDGTLEWLSKQKDIVFIVQHNRGEWNGKNIPRRSWGYFMNLGFRNAAGKYICMLSDDCVIHPEAIKNGIQSIEHAESQGKKVGAAAFYWKDWPRQNYYEIGITLKDMMYVNHGLYLKEAMQEVDFVDEKRYMFYFADIDLCLKMASSGYECIEASDSYVVHYAHANEEVRHSNAIFCKQESIEFKKRWEGIFYDALSNSQLQTKKRRIMDDKDFMDEIQANDSPFKHQEQKNPKIRLIV